MAWHFRMVYALTPAVFPLSLGQANRALLNGVSEYALLPGC
jgi:hypothetical protein